MALGLKVSYVHKKALTNMYVVAVNRSTRTWTHMYMLLMLPIANKHILRKHQLH